MLLKTLFKKRYLSAQHYDQIGQDKRWRRTGIMAFLFVSTITCLHTNAETIGGIDFPQGDISFADAVVSYEPDAGGAIPSAIHSDPTKALGLPQAAGNTTSGPCTDAASCPFVSLGDGGSIVLKFTDNYLTGSDSDAFDLWVFEIGSDVEDTHIEISKDGITWYSVGTVYGTTSGINIDAYGFDSSDWFSYIRLTDDPYEGYRTGPSVGADIDAVGAITTVSNPVVEYDGVEFPQGDYSFADAVVSYSPDAGGAVPSGANSDPEKALGSPQVAGSTSVGPCYDVSTCSFVSLGDGGSVVLKFTDNYLTGSDSGSLDLWIFEVGPDVEDTDVEISKDGIIWYSVGTVYGTTAGIDIDAYGFNSSDWFSYIRLTDDTYEGYQSGPSVGADIDAVGAISTVIIPEPCDVSECDDNGCEDQHCSDNNDSTEKVEVCHLPPGNTGKEKTVRISLAAIDAHMAHGDYPGSCMDDDKSIKQVKNGKKVKGVNK